MIPQVHISKKKFKKVDNKIILVEAEFPPIRTLYAGS
jgi:hypothetical protein